jgi:hypothetical protein
MKASLCIEASGYNIYRTMRGFQETLDASMYKGFGRAIVEASAFRRWCVLDVDDMCEVFGKVDYSQANAKASRGVRIFYTLESGKTYFVKAPLSWSCCEEYLCRVGEDGNITRLPIE